MREIRARKKYWSEKYIDAARNSVAEELAWLRYQEADFDESAQFRHIGNMTDWDFPKVPKSVEKVTISPTLSLSYNGHYQKTKIDAVKSWWRKLIWPTASDT